MRLALLLLFVVACAAFHFPLPSNSRVASSAQRLDHASAKVTMAFKEKHTESVVDISPLLTPMDIDPLARKAKIVATLGPASLNVEMLEKLIKAGVNVFRLNSSHRQPGQFEQLVPDIRGLSEKLGLPVEILGDLQGPKFRCGTVTNEPMPLEEGSVVEFALMKDDDDNTVPGRITLSPTTEQTALVNGLQVGMTLLLDDGFMAVKVVERVDEKCVKCEVVRGGALKSRKGINVPELQIDCSALTVKDKEDAEFLLGVGVDYIALSFVQKGSDIQELIDIMEAKGLSKGTAPRIIPKIEKPAALKNIDDILELADGLMVARGDMGVELGLERVPFAQKYLIRKCNAADKFCITATQMMESMISASVPTRAEVSDVANAIFDGTDAVMLSGESAVGADPPNTVEYMGRTIVEAESHLADISPSF